MNEKTGIQNLIKASAEQNQQLINLIGEKSFHLLQRKGLSVFVEPGSSQIRTAFVIPVPPRVITITNNLDLGITDISFLYAADYANMMAGVIEANTGFSKSGEKLQPGTIDFFRFLRQFVAEISDETNFRLIAEQRRLRLYSAFLKKIEKPNISIIPDKIEINLE